MRRQTMAAAGAAMTALALVVSALAQTSTATAAAKAPTASSKNAFGGFKHLVVIYEENHSFDNLYGQWGKVGSRKVNGLAKATPAHTTQVAQNGQPYKCLLQNDVNLTTGPLSGSCGTDSVPQADGTTVTYTSHFTNKAFSIDKYIKATDTTCPPIDNLFGFPNGVLKGQGTPGGCTRDLVHKFYQEQYQINGGHQNRYVTGSDAVGLTMGHYKTADLPIYRYLHGKKAPHYVIADHFFQAAFGGSYLNHQFLVAAQPPLLSPTSTIPHSVLDGAGMVKNNYPLYRSTFPAQDNTVTQACGLPTTVAGFACGDWSVNTSLPATQPTAAYGPKIPLIDDTTHDLTIGDRLSDAGVSWAWYAGGWDNAAGNVGGRGYTNGPGPTCADPTSAPAGPDASGRTRGYPYCPNKSFQQHHQPLAYFARYAPGTPGRARTSRTSRTSSTRLAPAPCRRSASSSRSASRTSTPATRASRTAATTWSTCSRRSSTGPEGKNTLIVVTYDEFGGQWDHVSPPGKGRSGPHDQFGPGTRIPALIVSSGLTASSVDHDVYDTTSIMATIEARYGLEPVDHPAGIVPRDGRVAPLTHAINLGLHKK